MYTATSNLSASPKNAHFDAHKSLIAKTADLDEEDEDEDEDEPLAGLFDISYMISIDQIVYHILNIYLNYFH
jgi:hypothetical protein